MTPTHGPTRVPRRFKGVSSSKRTRRLFPILPCALFLSLAAAPARGQGGLFHLEIRGGGGLPVRDFAEAGSGWAGGAGAGVTFGLHFALGLYPGVYAYGGFSEHRFRCPREGCGAESNLTATGFDGGIKLVGSPRRLLPWLRLGVLSYRAEGEMTTPEGRRSESSGRDVGLEAGAGIAFRVADRYWITPGLRYAHVGPVFPGRGELGIRAIVADLGLTVEF